MARYFRFTDDGKRVETTADDRNAIPRRCFSDQLTPAEATIRAAMRTVEEAGADPLLTDAITLLDLARRKVADFVDREA